MAAKTTSHAPKAQKQAAKLAAAMHHKAPAKEQVAAPKAKGGKVLAASSIAAGAVTPTIQRNEGDTTAAPMTPKNFRNHPDMENFFRFIYENDLRLEALQIIDEIIVNRAARRKKGSASAPAPQPNA